MIRLRHICHKPPVSVKRDNSWTYLKYFFPLALLCGVSIQKTTRFTVIGIRHTQINTTNTAYTGRQPLRCLYSNGKHAAYLFILQFVVALLFFFTPPWCTLQFSLDLFHNAAAVLSLLLLLLLLHPIYNSEYGYLLRMQVHSPFKPSIFALTQNTHQPHTYFLVKDFQFTQVFVFLLLLRANTMQN